VTRQYFVPERDFEVGEYIGSAWSMHPEGKLYHVKLWFSESASGAVTETLWHSSQESVRQSDGSAIVEFRLDGLNEVKWWILGYGDQVRVLSPEELKEEIVKIARHMVRMNRPGGQ
jgi:predicted DNA-binding transcriptional regulator YafY